MRRWVAIALVGALIVGPATAYAVWPLVGALLGVTRIGSLAVPAAGEIAGYYALQTAAERRLYKVGAVVTTAVLGALAVKWFGQTKSVTSCYYYTCANGPCYATGPISHALDALVKEQNAFLAAHPSWGAQPVSAANAWGTDPYKNLYGCSYSVTTHCSSTVLAVGPAPNSYCTNANALDVISLVSSEGGNGPTSTALDQQIQASLQAQDANFNTPGNPTLVQVTIKDQLTQPDGIYVYDPAVNLFVNRTTGNPLPGQTGLTVGDGKGGSIVLGGNSAGNGSTNGSGSGTGAGGSTGGGSSSGSGSIGAATWANPGTDAIPLDTRTFSSIWDQHRKIWAGSELGRGIAHLFPSSGPSGLPVWTVDLWQQTYTLDFSEPHIKGALDQLRTVFLAIAALTSLLIVLGRAKLGGDD